MKFQKILDRKRELMAFNIKRLSSSGRFKYCIFKVLYIKVMFAQRQPKWISKSLQISIFQDTAYQQDWLTMYLSLAQDSSEKIFVPQYLCLLQEAE